MIIGKPLIVLLRNNYPYLTLSGDQPFDLSCGSPQWDGTLEYSTNGASWTAWNGSAIQSAASLTQPVDVIYLRGRGNTKIAGTYASRFAITPTATPLTLEVSGNIETLLDCETVANGGHPAMAASCFAYLFHGCSYLTTLPTLASVTLAESCYQSMFEGCTSLVAPIMLPVYTFPQYACQRMFYGCSSIRLSATMGSPYTYSYRISSETLSPSVQSDSFADMFTNTSGTFTGTPLPGTIYYCTNSVAGA